MTGLLSSWNALSDQLTALEESDKRAMDEAASETYKREGSLQQRIDRLLGELKKRFGYAGDRNLEASERDMCEWFERIDAVGHLDVFAVFEACDGHVFALNYMRREWSAGRSGAGVHPTTMIYVAPRTVVAANTAALLVERMRDEEERLAAARTPPSPRAHAAVDALVRMYVFGNPITKTHAAAIVRSASNDTIEHALRTDVYMWEQDAIAHAWPAFVRRGIDVELVLRRVSPSSARALARDETTFRPYVQRVEEAAMLSVMHALGLCDDRKAREADLDTIAAAFGRDRNRNRTRNHARHHTLYIGGSSSISKSNGSSSASGPASVDIVDVGGGATGRSGGSGEASACAGTCACACDDDDDDADVL